VEVDSASQAEVGSAVEVLEASEEATNRHRSVVLEEELAGHLLEVVATRAALVEDLEVLEAWEVEAEVA